LRENIWTVDFLLHSRGYSTKDIDNMEIEQYNFIKYLIMALANKGKLNSFGGL